MDNNLFARQIKLDLATGGRPSEKLITSIVNASLPLRYDMEKLYNRYKAEKAGTPIIDTPINTDGGRQDNRIHANFMRKVVHTKVGYYASNITYSIDKTAYNEADYEKADRLLQSFLIRNKESRLDSTVAKFASICGYGVKMLYNKGGEIYCENILPYECVFISETEAPQYAMRYYPSIEIDEYGIEVKYWQAEFYTIMDVFKYKLLQADTTNNTYLSTETPDDTKHLIPGLPLIQYRNNQELSPDCDNSVLSLIDAYNRIISNAINDQGEFSAAIMALSGIDFGKTDEERKAKAAELKAGKLWDLPEGSSAAWLVKPLNIEYVKGLLEICENDIYKLAFVINMNDAAFGGNASGVAMKYKMLDMENACLISENEFRAANYELWKAVCIYWAVTEGVSISPESITQTFIRNFPQDLESEARANQMLTGLVSKRTQLENLSIVKDVEREMQQIEEEEAGQIDLDTEMQAKEEAAKMDMAAVNE